MEGLEQCLGLKPHHSQPIGFWKVLLSETISAQKEEAQQSLSAVLELRLFSSDGGQQVTRLMESSVLLCKGGTPWQWLLLTGKGTHSLTVWGEGLRGRLEFPKKEDRILGRDSRFLFATLVHKVQ